MTVDGDSAAAADSAGERVSPSSRSGTVVRILPCLTSEAVSSVCGATGAPVPVAPPMATPDAPLPIDAGEFGGTPTEDGVRIASTFEGLLCVA